MGNNLPPGTWPGDPKAPWNQEPPDIETKAMAVTLDVEIEVPEYAEADRERREIERAIKAGKYQLITHETAEVLDRRHG